METTTKSWGLTEVGQDGEINHSHFLKGVIRHIPNQHGPKRNPGRVGKGSRPDAPRPPCHCKESWTSCLDIVTWCLNAPQSAYTHPGICGYPGVSVIDRNQSILN